MPCCGDREKAGPVALEEQWDYVNLDDFKSESCMSPISYFFLFVFVIISIAVYAVDTFTAVTLLAFSRWAGQIEPEIPFNISRWIFAACIFTSFALLVYRWIHAIRAIRSGSIAQCYLNSLAARVQSLRMGRNGRGWRRFLVFAELTSSKKGADYVALFAYFSFESWMNTVFADGPRQVVNAITLYSVMKLNLLPGGENAVHEDKAGILQFFDNVKILAESNNLRALVLAGMTFTLVIWVLSILKLALAIILYLLFLFHHIPSEDGTLTAYCRRKINTRLKRIVRTKVNKALAKGVALQDRAPTNLNLVVDRKPTLPVFGDDDKTPIVSTLSRTTTQTSLSTLPPYASRPGTAQPERQPTLPNLSTPIEKPPLSRTATQSSAYTDVTSWSGTTAVSGYSPLDRQTSSVPPLPPMPSNISSDMPMPSGRSQTPMSRSNYTPAPSSTRGPPSRMASAAGSRDPRERYDPYNSDGYQDSRTETPYNPYAPATDPYKRNMTSGITVGSPQDTYSSRSFTPAADPYTRNMTPGAAISSPQDSYSSRSFNPAADPYTRNMTPGAAISSPQDSYSSRSFNPAADPHTRNMTPGAAISSPQDSYSSRSFNPAADPHTRNMTPGAAISSPQDSYSSRSFTPASQGMRGPPVHPNDDRAARTFSPVSARGTPRPQEAYTAYGSQARNSPAPPPGSNYPPSNDYNRGPPPRQAYSSRTYTPQPQSRRPDHF